MQQRNLPKLISRLSWDDLKIVLAAAELGSFRKAARHLDKDIATVTRRIKGVEKLIGEKLFTIMPNGVEPTPSGSLAAMTAQRMESSFVDFVRDLEHVAPAQSGIVRVAATEGLGTYWVMPRLVEFQRAFPRLTVDLRVAMESVDVLRHEADVALQFSQPSNPDLIATRLARMHICPFASTVYEQIYGLPTSIDEMAQHRLVDQVGPQLDSGVWPSLLGLTSIENIVGIRTNGSSALLFAVEKGAGIGGLPSYAAALGADVVPVNVDIRHSLDIWLTYHPSMKDVQRVSTVVTWLRNIFNPETYPWFRDDFIHPNDLANNRISGLDASFGQAFRAANPA